jgi:hypothetical protein
MGWLSASWVWFGGVEVFDGSSDVRAEGFGMLDCRDFTNAALPSEQSRPGNAGNNIMVRCSRLCRSCLCCELEVCICGG